MKKWSKLLGLIVGLAASVSVSGAGPGTTTADASAASDTAAAISNIASYGSNHLIKQDGSLWVWGGNRSVPTQVTALQDVQASFSLYDGAYITAKDHSVWKWQTNTRTLAMEAAQVKELDHLTGLYQVGGRYIAVTGDGAVHQAAVDPDGVTLNPFEPVAGIDHVAAVSGYDEDNEQDSWRRFLFLQTDGSVWTSIDNLSTFQPVRNLNGIIQLDHHYALAKDGSVWTWPVQSRYTPGTGSTVLSPVQVKGLTNIRMIQDNGRTSLAIDDAANLWFWGCTVSGFSDGTTYHEQAVPIRLTGISHVTEAYVIERSVVALTSEGNVYTASIEGESITAGTKFNLLASDVASMKAGGRHVIMQKNDGTLWGWGVNKNAQLGYANYDFSFEKPVPMQKPISVSLNGQVVSLTNGVITRGGQNFVPLRSLFDKLGATVAYKEDIQTRPAGTDKPGATLMTVDKKALITRTTAGKPPLSIVINTVSGAATVNDKAVNLATPPFVVNGTVYLPLRFISEQLGATVNWLPQQEEIAITMK